MRKTTFVILFFVFSSLAFAQCCTTTIGFKLMPGLASINSSFGSDLKFARFATSGGIEIRQRILKDIWHLETGIFYLDRGYGLSTEFSDLDGKYTGTKKSKEYFYFLTIPVSLVIKHKGIIIGAGPNMNYYVARRFVFDGDLISTDKSFFPEKIIFGAQLFTGYEFKISKNILLGLDLYIHPTFKILFRNYGLGIGIKYAIAKD